MGDYFDTKGDGTYSFDTGPGSPNPPKETPSFSLKPPGVIIRPDATAAAIRAERDELLLQNKELQNRIDGMKMSLDGIMRMEEQKRQEHATALRLIERMKSGLEIMATGQPEYTDGDAMGFETYALVLLGRKCQGCGGDMPCKEHPSEKWVVSSNTCDHGNELGWCRAVGCKNESDSRKFR